MEKKIFKVVIELETENEQFDEATLEMFFKDRIGQDEVEIKDIRTKEM